MPTNGKELTPRQTEVVRLVCSGLRNEDIGKLMKISTQTVEVHRYNAYRVLGVTNTAQLLNAALERKIVVFTKKRGIQ